MTITLIKSLNSPPANVNQLYDFDCSIINHSIKVDDLTRNQPHSSYTSLLPSNLFYYPQDNLLALINLQSDVGVFYKCSPIKQLTKSSPINIIPSPPFQSASLTLKSIHSLMPGHALSIKDGHPRFLETFNDIIVEPKSRLSLKCVATGSPLPQIMWTLDSASIGENHRVRVGDFVSNDGMVNSFVNITSITVREGGSYTCTASNGHHSVQHSARLTVYGKPFVKPMENITALSGTNIIIPCPYSGHPITAIAWYKGEVKLPENRRQLVFNNGTLVIKSANREADQGRYRCIVNNGAGDSASGDVVVRVRLAPLISIDSPINLRESMRSMLTCNVLEGDPPFTFKWLKDGKPINHLTSNNINISSLNEYSSTLFISELTFMDSGNYTCFISNDVAFANHTVNMLVKGKP